MDSTTARGLGSGDEGRHDVNEEGGISEDEQGGSKWRSRGEIEKEEQGEIEEEEEGSTRRINEGDTTTCTNHARIRAQHPTAQRRGWERREKEGPQRRRYQPNEGER